MAYNFNNSTDYVEFAIAPFTGYTFGAFTIAALIKRSATAGLDQIAGFTDSGLATTINWIVDGTSSSVQFIQSNGTGTGTATTAATSSSVWYLAAVTRTASVNIPRFHLWNGSTWSHETSSGGSGALPTIVGTDRLRFPGLAFPFGGDIATGGIKKADSSDGTIQTLSPTSFASWLAFGFDWLVGFTGAGTLVNQGGGPGGNEIGRSGTSQSSNPPGWSFGSPGGFLSLM